MNYEGGGLLLECVASLRAQGVLETIVVDNGSVDGSTAAAASEFPDLRVVTPGRNLGFAGGANLGAHQARGGLLLFLNPDVRLPAGSVRTMAARFAEPRVGVVAPPLQVEAAGAVEYGATVDVIGSLVGLTAPASPMYVPGCALMTRSALFREIGGFDERYFMFVEDVDYCWRALLRGFDVTVPAVEPAWHYGGATAPGGYIDRDNNLSSTLFRVSLRERNTLAMLLKCYGAPLAAIVTPVYVAQSLATACVLAARGHRATALAIAGGLRWNLRELARTLEMRRQVQASRTVGDTVIVRRMYRGIWKLHLLRRFGIPSVSEDGPAPVETSARRHEADPPGRQGIGVGRE